jgi:Major royal jelly protein
LYSVLRRYNTSGVDFSWHDGVFGFGLAPLVNNDRTLYFTPMSGTRAFAVPTSALRNETSLDDAFTVLPQRGGGINSQWHAGATAMSNSGVMFYNLVTRDAVACWNSQLPYLPNLQGEVARDPVTLNFPNDIKIDEYNNIWVLSNRLPRYAKLIYVNLEGEEGFQRSKIKTRDCKMSFNFQ